MKDKEKQGIVIPDADLISAMESLKIYGGKGHSADPDDLNYYCKGAYCSNCKCSDQYRSTETGDCNIYCGTGVGCQR